MMAISVNDLREAARRRLPRMVFDYIDGGADDESTLRRNRERFFDYELRWSVLVDVSHIETSVDLFGHRLAAPLLLAPAASARLYSPRAGERAAARAAHRMGTIYCVSTLASTSIEDIAAETPGPKLFQVYMWKDRGLVREILQRAKAAGYAGLILTVDTPVAGNRERDPRNAFSIPPRANWRTVTQILARPGYLWDLATTPRIGAANFSHLAGGLGSIVDFINDQFDRTVSWRDAAWLREQWGSEFAIKGVCTPDDAERCLEVGAGTVWLSNHGGRQLDTSPAAIDLVAPVAERLRGRAKLVVDGGVRRGGDVAKAVALGADAVAIGRPYLWGLAAYGERGVERALVILVEELKRTMALLGRPRLSDLNADVFFQR